jgi:hypothetical protein
LIVLYSDQGVSCVATTSAMLYPHYIEVENWDRLFFRVQPSP